LGLKNFKHLLISMPKFTELISESGSRLVWVWVQTQTKTQRDPDEIVCCRVKKRFKENTDS